MDSEPLNVRDTLDASNQSCGDLLQNGQPLRRATFVGPQEVDSTKRYLGVDLEDALSIAERIDIQTRLEDGNFRSPFLNRPRLPSQNWSLGYLYKLRGSLRCGMIEH